MCVLYCDEMHFTIPQTTTWLSISPCFLTAPVSNHSIKTCSEGTDGGDLARLPDPNPERKKQLIVDLPELATFPVRSGTRKIKKPKVLEKEALTFQASMEEEPIVYVSMESAGSMEGRDLSSQDSVHSFYNPFRSRSRHHRHALPSKAVAQGSKYGKSPKPVKSKTFKSQSTRVGSLDSIDIFPSSNRDLAIAANPTTLAEVRYVTDRLSTMTDEDQVRLLRELAEKRGSRHQQRRTLGLTRRLIDEIEEDNNGAAY